MVFLKRKLPIQYFEKLSGTQKFDFWFGISKRKREGISKNSALKKSWRIILEDLKIKKEIKNIVSKLWTCQENSPLIAVCVVRVVTSLRLITDWSLSVRPARRSLYTNKQSAQTLPTPHSPVLRCNWDHLQGVWPIVYLSRYFLSFP